MISPAELGLGQQFNFATSDNARNNMTMCIGDFCEILDKKKSYFMVLKWCLIVAKVIVCAQPALCTPHYWT